MSPEILLWETKHWRVILSDDQLYLGRSVAEIKREPCASLSELSSEEWLDLSAHVIQPFEHAVKKAFGAEVCNWGCLMNVAFQASPPNPHVHWHVKPRYRQPVEINGETFVDETFGRHYLVGVSKEVSPLLREEIAKRIREAAAVV